MTNKLESNQQIINPISIGLIIGGIIDIFLTIFFTSYIGSPNCNAVITYSWWNEQCSLLAFKIYLIPFIGYGSAIISIILGIKLMTKRGNKQ